MNDIEVLRSPGKQKIFAGSGGGQERARGTIMPTKSCGSGWAEVVCRARPSRGLW